MILMIGIIGYAFITYQWLMGIIAAAFIFMALRYSTPREEQMVPKLLVSNDKTTTAPFVDATGSHAGALLGDVRHDPFQSGGLETPAHDRVEAGAIHRAHKGVLFVDEINTLGLPSQQSLLTAMQECQFAITGQSERSSGAMVRTEPSHVTLSWWLPGTWMLLKECTRLFAPVSGVTDMRYTWKIRCLIHLKTGRSSLGSLHRR